jgi:hypothetical protein
VVLGMSDSRVLRRGCVVETDGVRGQRDQSFTFSIDGSDVLQVSAP